MGGLGHTACAKDKVKRTDELEGPPDFDTLRQLFIELPLIKYKINKMTKNMAKVVLYLSPLKRLEADSKKCN